MVKQHALKAYWERVIWLHTFLTSALDGDELPESFPGPFTPEVRAPASTEQEVGWAPDRSELFGKRKIFASSANLTLHFIPNYYLYVIWEKLSNGWETSFFLIFDPVYTYSLWVCLSILNDTCTHAYTRTHTHTHTHTVGLLWTADRPTQTPLPDNTQHSAEFEPAIPGGDRPQNALDRASTGLGCEILQGGNICSSSVDVFYL